MHGVDQGDSVVGGSLRQNAVTEIKDMARSSVRLGQNALHAAANFRPIGKQHGGIEIALYAPVVADRPPSDIEIDSPVDADHLSARLRQ